MNNSITIPDVIKKTIWQRGDDQINLDGIIKAHKKYEPTIELFFEGYFIGILCYKKSELGNEFDEEKANVIFEYVQNELPNIA